MLDHFVSIALKVAGQVRNGACGSDRQQTARLQCLVGRGDPAFVVYEKSLFASQRRGVEMDQNRVQTSGLFVERIRAGIGFNHHTRIVERSFGEKLAVPIDQLAAVFGNGVNRTFLR